MDQLNKIIIALAIKQINYEGYTDENSVANLVNELSKDAMLENPTTEKGKKIRKEALSGGVKSPYLQKEKYDMNALYNKTVNASIKPIFEVIAKYACPELGRPLTKATEESDKKLLKLNNDMSIEIFKILNQNKVPLGWVSELMQDLKAIIVDLDSIMKRQVMGHTKEVLSRSIGSRHPDPVNNGFDSNFATYADLLKAREELIKQTGGKIEDYRQDYSDNLG